MTVSPPRWTLDELTAFAARCKADFKAERTSEPLEKYLEEFDAARASIEDFLELTSDLELAQLNDLGPALAEDPRYLTVLRFLGGPFISEDDLKTVAETTLSPGRIRADNEAVRRITDTVLTVLDRRRFVWVSEDRPPTYAEQQSAIEATAALMATEAVRTWRRNAAKKGQEGEVAECLRSLGFGEVETRTVTSHATAPAPGTFCVESMFGAKKADLVVGLRDGRYMPIECKVSNSSVNSVKRVVHEAGGKATTWLRQFGDASTVPAAVLAGVFRPQNLLTAQDVGLTLFWQHDLSSLVEFVEAAR